MIKSVFVASFVLCATTCWASGLSTPLTAAENFPAYATLPPDQATLLLGPALAWQADAKSWVTDRSERLPADGFRLLRRGVAIDARGRDLPVEFLSLVSDGDLAAMFEWSSSDEPAGTDAPQSRLKLAESVLARPALSSRHPQAHIERARMLILLGAENEAVRSALQQVESLAASSEAEKSEAAGYLEVLSAPSTPAGFAASQRLLDLVTKYKRREVGTYIANRVLKSCGELGSSALFSGPNSGSLEGGRAVIRAAFELADKRVALSLADQVAERAQWNPEVAAEALYYAAMCEYADSEFERAIPLFQRVINLAPESPFAGAALLRIGGSHVHRARYGEAVVAFDDVRIGHAGKADLVNAANRHIDFLITSGFLSRLEVQEALLLSSRRRTTAMAAPQVPASGGAK